jgi:hypothetical protein
MSVHLDSRSVADDPGQMERLYVPGHLLYLERKPATRPGQQVLFHKTDGKVDTKGDAESGPLGSIRLRRSMLVDHSLVSMAAAIYKTDFL